MPDATYQMVLRIPLNANVLKLHAALQRFAEEIDAELRWRNYQLEHCITIDASESQVLTQQKEAA
ncbi:MAG: hypothetical protein H6974_13055 [Gammaproteobacteria bacterium]|nr:hypothetical protein [Gammaproteobacteria bacterium]MCP5197693.1 hypothetical protein [Gammaproteobacteria bacterium]